jgi:hypothetical protein
VKFALAHPLTPVMDDNPVMAYGMGALSASDSAGFHGSETHQGLPFRWTSTIAALRLRLAPGAYELVLRTNGVRRARDRHVALHLDGRRLGGVQINADSTELRTTIGQDDFARSDQHWLTIVCPPLKEAGVHGPARRLLGLPVTAVELHPVEAAPARTTQP